MIKSFDIRQFTPINCEVLDGRDSTILICGKEGGRLQICGKPGSLGGIDWKDKKYIVIDAINHENWVVGVTLSFGKRTITRMKPILL